ncbi:MAG: hypothetical protein RSE17_03460 [Bacilli bacterium]
MKKFKNILYMCDNLISLYNTKQNKILTYKLTSDILKNGKIANINSFIDKYKVFLKEKNLNNNILGESINIIINPSLTKCDKDILINIFKNLNYRTVLLTNEIKLYKLNSTSAFINMNEEYTILTYINEFKEKISFLIENNLLTESQFLDLVITKINNKEVFIFGLSSSISSFITSLETKNNNVIYEYSNKETFLIDSIYK